MNKLEVLIPIGSRSDAGLSKPLIKRLINATWCECHVISLEGGKYLESYKITEDYLTLWTPDLVICTGDRIEMEAFGKCCFLHNIPIAHFYAGVIDYSFVLFDDILRHQITLMADMAFCEDSKSAEVVEDLWETIGKYNPKRFRENIHVVGISHMDDLELDESLVPSEPYDLILINGVTAFGLDKNIDTFNNDIHEASYKSKNKQIWIGSNPDLPFKAKVDFYYDNLPRPQFLGLLKNCTRYITNSSNVNYEARPLGLKDEQIIQVGLRNKGRTTPTKLEVGASDKIVKILKKWWENEGNS